MSVIDLFLICIYTHFCEMKEKGRPVVPWFQTVATLSLEVSISSVLLMKIFVGNNSNSGSVSVIIFWLTFLGTGLVCFFSIKQYLFNSGRNISLSESYMNQYSFKQRQIFKIVSICAIMIIPILLGFIVWYKAV